MIGDLETLNYQSAIPNLKFSHIKLIVPYLFIEPFSEPNKVFERVQVYGKKRQKISVWLFVPIKPIASEDL